MAYSTRADMEKLLPLEVMVELTDDEGLGVVNEARLAEAIGSADAEMEGYLRPRYALPVSPAPDLLRKLSVDISIYNLYGRSVMSVPEVRAERYKAAIRMLEALGRGSVGLGAAPAAAASQDSSGAETNCGSEGRVFSRGAMEGF